MRGWTAVSVLGCLLVLGGCNPDELLEVDNPDEIQIDRLNDVGLLEVQLNGVRDQFYGTYSSPVIEYANFATDEMITGLNWEDYARVNQRIISYLEGPTTGIFEGLSRGLRMGDGLVARIEGWETEFPERDFGEELALANVFAGYSALVMGENMCQSVVSEDPDDPSGTVLSQDQVFGVAIPYLQAAITAAQAAGEDDIANLARTGLARAYLGQGEWQQAANAADAVEAGFEWWIPFVDIGGGRNPLQNTSHGGNFTHGIHPSFTGTHPSFEGTGFSFRDDDIIAPQTDPRIQHMPSDQTGHNALTPLYKLFQGLRYSEYTGETIAPQSADCPDCTGTDPDDMPLLTEFDTDILLADELEARHHYYEALAMMGGNEAEILAFVNERREAGNQDAVTLSGQALIDELREQRARDLFMGGFRLPDLRRWTRFDAGNGPFDGGSYFPTGTHPNTQWGSYGPWTCFPIPLSEYEGNPNLQRPIDPNEPPSI